jgi:hypothetical protein
MNPSVPDSQKSSPVFVVQDGKKKSGRRWWRPSGAGTRGSRRRSLIPVRVQATAFAQLRSEAFIWDQIYFSLFRTNHSSTRLLLQAVVSRRWPDISLGITGRRSKRPGAASASHVVTLR